MAESAATYVSVMTMETVGPTTKDDTSDNSGPTYADETPFPTAFSLPRFIPLLAERIYVINPFTRIFLVSWITLLDSIPDLELVTHLPAFLGGLMRFLSDPNQDVHVATQQALEGFLTEIKRIARVKRGIAESRKSRTENAGTMSDSGSTEGGTDEAGSVRMAEKASAEDSSPPTTATATPLDEKYESADGSWVPGQDVQVDHQKLLEILIPFLESPGMWPL